MAAPVGAACRTIAGGAGDIAAQLEARLLEPRNERTALVAQLRIPAPGGKVANIDVLHLLYTVSGLRKSSAFTKRVVQDSVEVEGAPANSCA